MDPTKHLEQSASDVDLPVEGESFVFPVSFAQGRLWLLSKLIPDPSVYNVPMAVRLRGPLDVEALSSSFDAILARHEVLRASFQEQDGSPVQVIPAAAHVEIPLVDLSHLPLQDAVRKAQSLAQENAATGFDLSRGPLLRASLVKVADQDHVLMFAIHHIVYDAWSRGVLWRELSEYYRSLTTGGAANLPELEIQYPDFSVWQRDYLSGETLEEQLQFWKQHLAGAPTALELPTDRPRPALQTFVGTEYRIVLPTPTLDLLKELSRREGATLFMTLLAAFNLLLARYSGQEDIVVGSPIAGRNRAEVENLIGFFVNTLPLRTDLSGNPTFKQLLSRVKEAALGAYAHQELPFEKLVEELKLSRELSRNPVFQVMFALQNVSQQKLDFPGLTVEPFRSGKRTTAKFDLSLTANDGPDGLALVFEYNTDLFEAATIERMASHLGTLLSTVAATPEKEIAQLELLSEAEREQQISVFNATEQDYPRDLCVHQLFEKQAEISPNAIAVRDGRTSLSYAELDRRANQLARFLCKEGVRPQALVAVCLERSVDMVVAVLAVLKAGAAYVPLDPAYPKDRIAFVVEDSQASVLLTQSSLLESLPGTSASRVCIDADWDRIATESAATPEAKTTPQRPTYVIYTSGSTGKPKGVEIAHQSVVNFLASMRREPGFGPQDILLGVTTLSFDIAGLELYLPLTVGGTVVIATREEASDGVRLMQRLQESKATVMQATPATWRLLIDSGWRGDANLKVLCGGEALPRELAERLLPRCRELWNMYGPTETTIWSSVYRVHDLNWTSAPIGHPIANTQMYVLDKNGRMVPAGVPGELHIGGDGLARGYWNRPDLTAQKFIADPFRPTPGGRLYKTGDLVRYLPDGNLQYLSRIDNQVKLRGFRIELGEIENVLAQHRGLQQCVVVVREDTPGDKRLVGYVVAKPGEKLDTGQIRDSLRQALPDYMVPATLVELDALPLTPNGKVDRKALPKPEYGAAAAKGEFTAPRTATEEIIAGIWAHVLSTAHIGIHDNFFELGGHSLLAMQVVSRVSQAFSVGLPLLALFEAPTVEGLAAKVTALQGRNRAAAAAPLKPISRTQPLQLSFAQQRLWFLDRLDPHSALYNVPLILRLRGSLNVRALRNALKRIVARHESLRTWFMTHSGTPVQMITPSLELDLGVTSVMSFPERVRETEARQLISSEVNSPFNLATGPLMRVLLVKIAETDHVLVLNTHHIVSDRWSLGVLREELVQYYEQELEGDIWDLPPLPIQYTDYAAWQRQLLSGNGLEEQLGYWKKKLQGAPASLELPTDRPRPAEQTFHGANVAFDLGKPVTEQLQSLGRREGATLFMTLLAAFNILLARYAGQDDIVIGSPISGRSRPELEKLIGFFVNTLVLRTQVDGNENFRQLLAKVRETAMGAYAHQDVPFEKLVEELKPERDLSRSPLFQVMFTVQNAAAPKPQMADLELSGFPQSGTTSKFDLTLIATETSAGLRFVFEYNTDLFEAGTVTRMAAHFSNLLSAIAGDPEQSIARLPMLSEAERQQILGAQLRATGETASACVHELVRERAERAPGSTAVVGPGGALTYSELETRANQLAHLLRSLGVGPEILVGLCFERSPEYVVSALAILKAGGAYVPIDPSYPQNRMSTMLEDCGAPIVLTSAGCRSLLPEGSWRIIPVDEGTFREQPTSAPENRVASDNLAYIIFTSGSTGRPKGVLVTHGNLANLVAWHRRTFEVGPADRATLHASPGFDAAVWELWPYLASGASVFVVDEAVRTTPEPLRDWLVANRITMSFLATPIAELMIQLPWPAETALRFVFTGGDTLRRYPPPGLPFSLVNNYGPTECTVLATSTIVAPDNRRLELPSIGKAIDNLQVYIVDDQLELVGTGVVGELVIGGAGVARGYLNLPDATAQRFVRDPFSNEANARLYRTGDRARVLSDGDIQFLGRSDQQVKVRGFRIELGEIENALERHAAVKQSAVALRNLGGEPRLAAYVVAQPGASADAADLRSHLLQILPTYMVPSSYTFLEQLPLTSSGKVDRKALPKPAAAEAPAGSVSPRNQVEERLLAIWRQVLQNPSMGVTDNFFDLGGHSLMAAQLVSEMEKAFGRKVPLAALFRGPTVEEMARVLREGTESAADPIVMRIQPGNTAPFFAVVAPGMDAIGYAALAQAMGPQQTFYKLQSHWRAKPDAPIMLEEMRSIAREYVQAMKTVQPKGPYYIGGMCAGTHIGEQMVLQLEAEGERIALFAIFDTWVRQNSHVRWKWLIAYYWQRTRGMLRLSFRKQLRMIGDALSKKFQQIASGKKPEQTSFAKLYWPGKDFKTPHFQAPVALFKRPKQPFFYIKDEAMGWGERSRGGVHIYRIDFPHRMLREPYVRELAKRLLECISRTAPTPVERLQVWPKVSAHTPATADIEA